VSIGERDQIAAVRADAFASLARELAEPVDARVCDLAGVPDALEAIRMLNGLEPIMLADAA
jgi:hypothetical protein